MFRQWNRSIISLFSLKWAAIWWLIRNPAMSFPWHHTWRTSYIEYIHMGMLCVKSNQMLFPYHPLDLKTNRQLNYVPWRSGEIYEINLIFFRLPEKDGKLHQCAWRIVAIVFRSFPFLQFNKENESLTLLLNAGLFQTLT